MPRISPVPTPPGGGGGRSHRRVGRLTRAIALATGLGVVVAGTTVALTSAASAATPELNAVYQLVSHNSGKALDISGFSTADDGAVVQWSKTSGSNQRFQFIPTGDGYYRIKAQSSGKVLDDQGWGTADGTPVVQYSDHNTANQQWKVIDAGSYIRLINRNSGKALDVTGNSTADGAAVVQYTDHNTANQQWGLVKVAAVTGPVTVPVTQPATPPPTSATPRPPAPPTSAPPAPQAPGSTSCGVAPVDPQASAQARKLLCYLYSQYGNHILSGQEESTWVGGPDYEMNFIQQNTGKLPAIRAMDIGDDSDLGNVASRWFASGGIVQVGYHVGAPNQGTDGYNGSLQKGNINAALTPGSGDNKTLNSRLDRAAAQLQKVQQAGGAVIWRPYHEAGGTWFWWSMEGGAQYQRLWKYTFDYMTKTKGLHNLVWLLPYNGSPQASFYPGKAYVDLAGADTYAQDHGAQTNLYNQTKNIVGTSIPIALHENGPIPDPAVLQSSGTKWSWFNTWHTSFLVDGKSNTTAVLKQYYNSSYVITKDELPNLE